MPLTTTSRVTEQVGGQIWGGVRYGYAITPQAAGTLEVPAIALTFEYAIDALPSGPFTVRTTALPLPVRLPPGAEALDYFFAAPALHLSERFDPHVPARLSIGEAFSRRIALAADDINGLTLPPVDIASPDGLRVSIEPPAMSTLGDEKTGTRVTRTQQVTYIAERPGHYTLPAVSVDYWSTSANAVRSVTLPAVSFDVAAAAAFHEEIALPPDQEVAAAPPSRWGTAVGVVRDWWRVVLGALAAIAVVSGVRRRLVPVVRVRVAAARRRRRESEAHFFSQVRHAARGGDLRATHAAALAWVARLPQMEDRPTLGALAARTDEASLQQTVARVEASLYGRGRPGDRAPSAASLLAGLERARATVLRRPPIRLPDGSRHLVPLNPPRHARQ